MPTIRRIAREQELVCPNCHRPVTVEVEDGEYVCPNCGYHGSTSGGEGNEKEGRRVTSNNVARLLAEAAKAPTLVEQQRLVGEAQRLRTGITTRAATEREVDLANAVIRDTLTPVRVHEHHTAATDWLGTVDTSGGEGVAREMVAQASLWYGRPERALAKAHIDEFTEQARGMARRLAGSFGGQAQVAEEAFFRHAATLYNRDVTSGVVVQAASGLPQVGDPGNPVAEATVGPAVNYGLDGPETGSNRAPAIQELINNTGGGSDDNGWPSPLQLPQHDVDAVNGDAGTQQDYAGSNPNDQQTTAARKEASMQHSAACPSCSGCKTCGGTHRVAVRRTAYSGLPQVDQIANADDSPGSTPLPTDVMFPWEMSPGVVDQTINEAEQQIAQRNQMQQGGMGAAAKRRTAGQDDSGWLGDMGAGGVGPGEQDGGNPPPYENLGQPDPVYGYGGDNTNTPLQPYGQDEADDVTNKPSQWAVGQPAQADIGGRGVSTMAAREAADPELQRALAFVRQRRAFLAGR